VIFFERKNKFHQKIETMSPFGNLSPKKRIDGLVVFWHQIVSAKSFILRSVLFGLPVPTLQP